MRNSIFIFLLGILLSMTSCRKDFEFEPSTGDLEFSRDTVYLDTVFTNVGSSTYTLKVYNRSNKDINIPKIQLAKGNSSKYRITVDGMEGLDEDNSGYGDGKIFNNVELLAKDSLYIFIETTAEITDANPTDFLYTDNIQFDLGSNLQKVELVTLIQDAVFLYPQKYVDPVTQAVTYESLTIGADEIYGFYLDESDPVHGNELVMTNQKPYVIYGYAGVPSGKTLTIDPGARIHFHAGSGIIVANGASIQVNGDISTTDALENEVIFEGDRLEPDFSDIPGQWGTIWLTSGSVNNQFNHATIKNAAIGLYIQDCPVSIKNTQIYDCSNFGILAQTATITGENIVINSAGQAALACTLGGSYEFKHCTFNNNWPGSNQLAVLVDNFYLDGNNQSVAFDLLQANFFNCIIYGSNQVEMLLKKNDTKQFNYLFNNCLVKFSSTNLTATGMYDFDTDTVHYNAIYKNTNPLFEDINHNKLNIEADSPSAGKGNLIYLVTTDVLGNPRTSNPPDLGAYQSAPFPL
ncbi:hypothetical protein [Flavobacterium sp. GT3R68]|uniref:hypothetical protein n=1 Tax=Flavobacterium sp. GT3R68 TaxID=2594437 RepID=UPI000F899CF6|nr:hypothetical protein [Flavobacterium sp. GT3R68]RTY95151.1 hypothetical protein EKL32_06885 [Flavobacterium sp. GSN2]TRW91107.1 hypothetical protein FNW07_09780 [Flavobacterium sp. GT3R68]